MARYIRNTAILAEIELTYGIDPVPTGAANAMLASNMSIALSSNNVDRDLFREYFGASEQLVGSKYLTLTFDVELQNGGTAGTSPAWGPLLRACAMTETDSMTPDRIEYTPRTTGQESVTIYYYLDGVLYKALGCKGNVKFALGVGERPLMQFSFLGLDGGISAATPTGVSYSAFKAPLVVTDSNTGELTLGGTYATGAITGGTAYTSQGVTLDLGNEVKFIPLIGVESVDITNRAATGSMALDLTAAQEVTARAAIDANTTTSMSMLHGSTAGYKILVFAPAVQRINPSHSDVDGRVMYATDLRLCPSSGNDELRIVCL